MKCATCEQKFEGEAQKKQIKVTLSNPGDVFCEGNINTCPHCDEDYVEGEDILELAESFDIAYKSKNKK